MGRRIVWALALFSSATALVGVLDRWMHAPLAGPAVGLVMTAVGIVLIGLSPSDAPRADETHALPREGDPVQQG